MNWLCTCFKKVWMCGMLENNDVSISKQITLIENKIKVLKSFENISMFKKIKGRLPIYEAILKTLKLVKK